MVEVGEKCSGATLEITHISIRNFRSIKSLELPLRSTTLLVGPNNSGKTAILDAVRIALGRRWGQRGTGFTEYDIHLPDDRADPKLCGPAVIELRMSERVAGEWPQELQDDLLDQIQNDPHGRAYIRLRVTCGWDAQSQGYEPLWEFLDAAGAPLRGGRRVTNTHPFFQYIPIFYMGALRDPADEFSAQSQFWGRLLKAITIPPALEARVMKVLDLVNQRLMGSDPRLAQITEELKVLTAVAAQDTAGDLQLRAVPLKAWDLVSRSEIILRNQTSSPWLPLRRHGQGVQSLSVVFLFETFVRQLLNDIYGVGSAPVLAIEEPEAHLHPQAARTMWGHINELPGQKIITTHSPYFVQHAPFRSIRLVRCTANGTEVSTLDENYSVKIPNLATLNPVLQKYPALTYDAVSGQLEVVGKMEEQAKRDLMTAFGAHNDRVQICSAIVDCAKRSEKFVSDATLSDLDEWARRIRGEIFFARKWLLVEGQSEHILLQGLAREMDYPLDRHGVTVIDYRNNGSLGPFVALARAFGIPWLALVDNDLQGQRSKAEVAQLGFSAHQLNEMVVSLEHSNLEVTILEAKNEALLRDILATECAVQAAQGASRADLCISLEGNKIEVAKALVARMRDAPQMAVVIPRSIMLMMLKLREHA
ncbi:AAA family ATPase [Bradyrhizobium huanghuaihaiense]|uniref:ATP-dependent nuclease n=1 Tax=Bradyrhizobium huanghuaihaiense TaxID=990078 RepID=UPI0021AA7665|nr:AAA family ATPase [Bradyrhizobium sp. CB3035]UWU78155.1 AAA family ATPase [Bradyrhizobium sp. CB3035]